MTKVGWYTIGTSTTLESNKSLLDKVFQAVGSAGVQWWVWA
jgi:hypothetical protein